MSTIDFLLILLTLLFSALFSGMEIAFVSSNKLKIELENKQGKLAARIYSRFLKNQSSFIGAMLVGNNIALVIYGILMAKVLEPFIGLITQSEVVILIVQTILSTLLVLISAEFLPKTLFRINPNRTLNIFAVPVFILFAILYPIVFITITLSNLILKAIFKFEIEEDKPIFGKVDLDNYLKQSIEDTQQDEEIENEVQIFQNALDFSHVKIRECMVPRTEIVALDIEEEVEVLTKKFIETGLSKILIYKESIDNIIGYVHSFDVFKEPKAIKKILLPISIIPETMAANDTLTLFIKKKRGIAVVVDEFGGTSGMITLEDLVEEIFGEIEDEYDKEEMIEEQLSDTRFRFSARLEIDHINTTYKLNLEESEEYETIAGYIIHHHENIPNQGDEIVIGSLTCHILKVNENRIEEVVLQTQEQED